MERRDPPAACSCDPEAYDLGPEGQRRYFPDRYCPTHGEAAAAIGEELTQQADRRVFTNDLDALEHLILHGELPPAEMQAAAWLLVQRVRGLREDLNRLQQALVRSRGMREYVEESRTHGR